MKVVILGGGYAGIMTALRLARRGRRAVEVTLVNASDRFVERIRLHERAAGRAARVLSITSLLTGTGVSVVIGRAVSTGDHMVVLEDGRTLVWDRLVLALGSRGPVGTGFSESARSHTMRVLERLGVRTLSHTGVARVERDRIFTRDESLPVGFDLCVWAAGFRGAELPAGLRVATNANGQVLVDPFMRSVTEGYADGHPAVERLARPRRSRRRAHRSSRPHRDGR